MKITFKRINGILSVTAEPEGKPCSSLREFLDACGFRHCPIRKHEKEEESSYDVYSYVRRNR